VDLNHCVRLGFAANGKLQHAASEGASALSTNQFLTLGIQNMASEAVVDTMSYFYNFGGSSTSKYFFLTAT